MKRVFRTFLYLFVFCFFFCGYVTAVCSQENDILYSLLFSWKTGGSHELLARKATAFKQLKTPQSLAISLGSLLGPTRIVQYDTGVEFMRAAHLAGIDYIIPAAGEFIFGVNTFRVLDNFSDTPEFISANIVNEKTRELIVTPYVIWHVSGMRICIIGISDINIIRDSLDENVKGIDVISTGEALSGISTDVLRENANVVILAGRMDRKAVLEAAMKHPYIDMFVTNNQAGGFTGKQGTTTTVYLPGKPIYIASEQANHLSCLTVKDIDGITSREFTDVTVGDEFPPDKELAARLNIILKELKQRDYEESVTVKAGKEVAGILKDVFGVDVALLERQSLFYYPLKDSLTVFNIRKVIKPSRRIITFSMKGTLLKSAWEQSVNQTDPALRLHGAGISDEGKVDSIPIQDDREYTVLTTTFLRSGGNGYSQFPEGINERRVDESMLEIVESYLVAKEKRLREAEKKKIWSLALNLELGSNFNKTDVDREQALYGDAPPKEFKKLKDLFTGHFEVSSWDDKLIIGSHRHIFESRLRTRYLRSGFRTEEGHISYEVGRDELILFNKYTYDLPGFKLKPFVGIDLFSELYAPGGKHPLSASARAGFAREIQTLWNMIIEIGLDGTRNYVKNENTFGTTNTLILSKSLPEKGLFTNPTKITIDARMTWNPMAIYHMAFFLRNNNRIDIQIWKKFNATFHVISYSYRDTRYRKIAVGVIYDFTLNYKMDWNF